ncbi:hypothetical protein PCASD_10291 [Puccinia coronata f. sp. avenae]|nr:hypothetical protein PCASD_10291 [Puccinia coronata f. sp. avenae]
MEGFHPIDHPIVQQEAADMKPALGHPDGPPPETTTKDTTISHTPTPDGTDNLASENSALRLQNFFGDKLSKLVSKMKPMRQRFDSSLVYLRNLIGDFFSKLLKSSIRSRVSQLISGRITEVDKLAISEPASGPFIPKLPSSINDPLIKNGNLDRELDQFFANPNLEARNFRRGAHMQGLENVLSALKKDYQGLGKVLQNDVGMEGVNNEKIQKLASTIQQSHNKEGRLSKDAMTNFAKRISNYKAQMLLKDQKMINSHLHEDQRYLSGLIDFFGPKKVFLPYVKEVMRTQEFLVLAPLVLMKPDQFLQNVQEIQQSLAKLIKLNPSAALDHSKDASTIADEIKSLEDSLISKFGERDVIKKVINKIRQSDIRKGFMREMNNPQSTRGLLLQLMEPWGYLRQLSSIPLEERPYQEFGMVKDGKILEQLDTDASKAAHSIIQEQLKSGAEAMEIQSNINKMFTPYGLANLELQLIKKTSKA